MGMIAWILVGPIGGTLAKLLMPGDAPGGILLTIVLGIAGALLGGFLLVALGVGNGVDDFDIGTIVLSVLGAMLILAGYRMFVRGRQVAPPPEGVASRRSYVLLHDNSGIITNPARQNYQTNFGSECHLPVRGFRIAPYPEHMIATFASGGLEWARIIASP